MKEKYAFCFTTLHLLFVGLWLGCVLTEALPVLITGGLLLQQANPSTALHLKMGALGMGLSISWL